MGRANVYLSDELERRVKAVGIPISEVCQRALLAAVEAAEGGDHQSLRHVGPQFSRGWAAAVSWIESAPAASLLTLLRDLQLPEIPREALADDLYSLTEEQALAWEAGFMEGARSTVRAAFPLNPPGGPGGTSPAGSETQEPSDSASASQQASEANSADGSDAAGLGDDSGCYVGATLDGDRVAFDPHAAVRVGKSPLFAILGPAELRVGLTLTVAQDAAARGTAVLLVDLSGQLTARATGAGKNVRVIRPIQAMPQLDDLVAGAVTLGGLWDTLARLSASSGLSGLFGAEAADLIEPGHVTVLSLAGDNPVASAISVAHAVNALRRLADPTDFPRLLQFDFPPGSSLPAPLTARLDRIIRTARDHDAAVGISAESVETATHVGAGRAQLSTVIAFATSSPVEADRLRDLLGPEAPVLLNPPGTPVAEPWAVMRDLNGRLGQLRVDGF